MKHEPDLSRMSKTMLQSELNAYNLLIFLTPDQKEYMNRLEAEINKRIEDECINDTQEV